MTSQKLTTVNLYLLLASPVVLGLGGIGLGYSLRPSTETIAHIPSLGQHYSRIVAPYFYQRDILELSRILASMVSDNIIVQASLYTQTGERIIQQGRHDLLPEILTNNPQWQSNIIAVEYESTVIGYLQWIQRPNSEQ